MKVHLPCVGLKHNLFLHLFIHILSFSLYNPLFLTQYFSLSLYLSMTNTHTHTLSMANTLSLYCPNTSASISMLNKPTLRGADL